MWGRTQGREALIKWDNIKRFLKNTECPTTRQPSPCPPPGISVRQTKNSKYFMGMFILVWFIKAPDWKQHRDLLMTEGWTNCSRSTAGNKEKKEQIPESSTPCGSPDMRRNHHRNGEQIGEREGGDKLCGATGATGWSLWWWKRSDVYYDVNTPCVNSTTVSQLVLREAEREIRELGKGTWLC